MAPAVQRALGSDQINFLQEKCEMRLRSMNYAKSDVSPSRLKRLVDASIHAHRHRCGDPSGDEGDSDDMVHAVHLEAHDQSCRAKDDFYYDGFAHFLSDASEYKKLWGSAIAGHGGPGQAVLVSSVFADAGLVGLLLRGIGCSASERPRASEWLEAIPAVDPQLG